MSVCCARVGLLVEGVDSPNTTGHTARVAEGLMSGQIVPASRAECSCEAEHKSVQYLVVQGRTTGSSLVNKFDRVNNVLLNSYY